MQTVNPSISLQVKGYIDPVVVGVGVEVLGVVVLGVVLGVGVEVLGVVVGVVFGVEVNVSPVV